MAVKSPVRIEAEKVCRESPDANSRTLAKKIAKSHQVTVEHARSIIRQVRGLNGSHNRKLTSDKSLFRERLPSGIPPEMPPSLAEPWLPFELGTGIKVAVLSDVHIPYHSATALKAAVDYTKKCKPDVLLLNGDFADFYSISRHQKDPSKRDFLQEIELVRHGLAWLRSQYGKQCRFVYKLGNHEERWQHWLWNQAAEICSDKRMNVGEWLDAKKYGVEIVQDGRPIMAGKLPLFHGHEFGKSAQSAVNPARGLFLRAISTASMGHGHRTSHHADADIWHTQVSCWTAGCLCELNPEYARLNKWNWGAQQIEVDSIGGFEMDNFRIGPSGEVWK